MGRPSNVSKEMLHYSFPIKERIFNPQFDYVVGQKVSDVWSDKENLFIEVTLSNLQKSIFKLQILANGILHLQYFQKQISKNVFNEHLNPELKSVAKINFQNDNQKIAISLANNEQLIFWKHPFQLELQDATGKPKFRTSDREGYDFFEKFITPPSVFGLKGMNYNLLWGLKFKMMNCFMDWVRNTAP